MSLDFKGDVTSSGKQKSKKSKTMKSAFQVYQEKLMKEERKDQKKKKGEQTAPISNGSHEESGSLVESKKKKNKKNKNKAKNGSIWKDKKTNLIDDYESVKSNEEKSAKQIPTETKDKKRKRTADEPGLVETESKKKKKKSIVKKGSVEEGKELLEFIMKPVGVNDFFENSFEKRPLHIKRGNSGYFKHIFSVKEFDQILRTQRVVFSTNLDVTSYSDETGRETHTPEGRACAPVVWDFYNNGCSLRMLNPQAFSDTVWAACATLQEFFGSMVGANVYLTPPGTQGFAPHYDDVEVFILQLEGRKRWRLYEPRNSQESLPRFSSKNFTQDEIGHPCMDIVLEAGDMLYFPRGTIHQGNCFEDTHSLHITISCHQLHTFGDLLNKIVPTALQIALEEDVDYRRGLPTDYLQYMGVCHSDNTSKNREVFIEKIKSLVDKLFTYAPIDAAVDQMGQKLMHDSLPPFLSEKEKKRCVLEGGERWDSKKNRVVNRVEIDPDTEIRLMRANILRLVTEPNNVVKIYYSSDNTRVFHEVDEQYVEIDTELAPAVETLITSYPEFTRAEDLPLPEHQLDLKMKVVQDLWERNLVVTKDPLDSYED